MVRLSRNLRKQEKLTWDWGTYPTLHFKLDLNVLVDKANYTIVRNLFSSHPLINAATFSGRSPPIPILSNTPRPWG
jgi:hypothetical protein